MRFRTFVITAMLSICTGCNCGEGNAFVDSGIEQSDAGSTSIDSGAPELDAGLSGDSGTDAGATDAGGDDSASGIDAGIDAGVDAGIDAAIDGGNDAGPALPDAGLPDAGLPDGGCCAYQPTLLPGVCLHDVDIAAHSIDRWSVVTFLEGAGPNEWKLALYDKDQNGLRQATVWLTSSPPGQPAYAFASVALDGLEQAHVATTDYWSTGQPLYFAPGTTGSTSINCGVSAADLKINGGTIDIAVNPVDDSVHLAWPAMNDAADIGYLKYARQTSSGWLCETVDQGQENQFRGPVFLAFDAMGDPVVAYRSTLGSYSEARVRRLVLQSWAAPPVDDAGVDVESLALGVSGQSVWVAVAGAASAGVVDVVVPGAMPPVVITSASSTTPRVVSTFIDFANRQCVGFLSGPGSSTLREALLTQTGWQFSDVTGPVNRAAGTVDAAGRAHFVSCGGTFMTHFTR